jgi:hypothetical protein
MAAFTNEQKTQARALLSNQTLGAFVTSIGGPDKLLPLLNEIDTDNDVLALVTEATTAFQNGALVQEAVDILFDGTAPRPTNAVAEQFEAALAAGNMSALIPLALAFAAASGIVKR